MNLAQHMSSEDFEKLTSDLDAQRRRSRHFHRISKDPQKQSRHAKKALATEKALCQVIGRRGGPKMSDFRRSRVEKRIASTTARPAPVHHVDRKSEKRLRDQEVRERMKGKSAGGGDPNQRSNPAKAAKRARKVAQKKGRK